MKTTFAALCCAALIVAGCGGGSDTLTRSQIAKKANAICAKYSKQGKNLGSPDLTDPAKAQDYFSKAKDLTQKQQSELEGLKPASSVKADYKKMTDATGQVTTLLGDLADAAKAKDRQKGVSLIQKLTPLSATVDSTATAVGAKSCAG
jgi:hypothetical protein